MLGEHLKCCLQALSLDGELLQALREQLAGALDVVTAHGHSSGSASAFARFVTAWFAFQRVWAGHLL